MPRVDCGYPDPKGGGSGLLVKLGPTLRVNVGFDVKYKPNPNTAPKPGKASIEALVDTGADEGCIDRGLALELKLPVVDRRTVGGVVGGEKIVDVFLAQIHVPVLRFTLYGSFSGVDLTAGGIKQPVLLGRTFLRHCAMSYDGKTGSVSITI